MIFGVLLTEIEMLRDRLSFLNKEKEAVYKRLDEIVPLLEETCPGHRWSQLYDGMQLFKCDVCNKLEDRED